MYLLSRSAAGQLKKTTLPSQGLLLLQYLWSCAAQSTKINKYATNEKQTRAPPLSHFWTLYSLVTSHGLFDWMDALSNWKSVNANTFIMKFALYDMEYSRYFIQLQEFDCLPCQNIVPSYYFYKAFPNLSEECNKKKGIC